MGVEYKEPEGAEAETKPPIELAGVTFNSGRVYCLIQNLNDDHFKIVNASIEAFGVVFTALGMLRQADPIIIAHFKQGEICYPVSDMKGLDNGPHVFIKRLDLEKNQALIGRIISGGQAVGRRIVFDI